MIVKPVSMNLIQNYKLLGWEDRGRLPGLLRDHAMIWRKPGAPKFPKPERGERPP